MKQFINNVISLNYVIFLLSPSPFVFGFGENESRALFSPAKFSIISFSLLGDVFAAVVIHGGKFQPSDFNDDNFSITAN